MPRLLKPRLFIIAKSFFSLNILGFLLPVCGYGVTAPTSIKLNPKANKLLMYKDKRLITQKSFNASDIDPYSTFSKVMFYDTTPIITSSYVRNSRVIEYQTSNAKIKTSFNTRRNQRS